MTLNTGILSGIFGLNGPQGFILYFVAFLVGSLCFCIKSKGNITKYFPDSFMPYFSGAFTDLLVNIYIFNFNLLAIYNVMGYIS